MLSVSTEDATGRIAEIPWLQHRRELVAYFCSKCTQILDALRGSDEGITLLIADIVVSCLTLVDLMGSQEVDPY